jgi:predicted  nucleic acid-binding Zn-ribbon protein
MKLSEKLKIKRVSSRYYYENYYSDFCDWIRDSEALENKISKLENINKQLEEQLRKAYFDFYGYGDGPVS